MKLEIAGRILVQGRWWSLGRPVLDARLIGGKVVVIYGGVPDGEVAAPNLVAYDLQRKLLWAAENPLGDATDGYSGFISERPLKVANSSGLDCRIDIVTGKIQKILFAR